MTRATLAGLADSVNWSRHRAIIVDNGSCEETQRLYEEFVNRMPFLLIRNYENLGTARALTKAWRHRRAGEHVLKIDSDVVVHTPNWLDLLEECVERDHHCGCVGGKRRDLLECPSRPEEWWRSELHMLPHEPGQRWLVVEKCRHVMGTCVLHSSRLLDKVGYLYQPGKYGYDDSLMSVRSLVAGFYNCFCSMIDLEHIDPGDTDYTEWKHQHSGQMTDRFNQLQDEYIAGTRSVYHGPDDE